MNKLNCFIYLLKNHWNFEWELMREWVGWVETPLTWWGERWGHHKFVAAFPSYKKRGEITLSSHTCCHLSPSTRCSIPWSSAWRSPDRGVFHHTTPSCCWNSGGSSTSAAPLDRGNGGRHQAERVTGHGGTAGLRCTSSRSWDRCEYNYANNEIRSRNALCLRGYDLLRLFLPLPFIF